MEREPEYAKTVLDAMQNIANFKATGMLSRFVSDSQGEQKPASSSPGNLSHQQ